MPMSRERRQGCTICGQVFVVHFEMEGDGAPVRTRVPCLSDACMGVVVVSHPRSAFALWVEEL